MKILLDVNHPAHVHILAQVAKKLSSRGDEFLFTAREKDVTVHLLREKQLPYVVLSKNGKSTLELFHELIHRTYAIFQTGRKFRPDAIVSCASPCAAWAAKLLSIPHIAVTDTEHASLTIFLMRYASDAIVTPTWFTRNLGRPHIRYAGFHEYAYLNPQAFAPDEKIAASYGLFAERPYSVVRFVEWNAAHDIGKHGLSAEEKGQIIDALLAKGPVVLSCEGDLPSGYGEKCITVSPNDIHHAMAFAAVFLGESCTMASEAALLGTPAVCTSEYTAGVLSEQERSGMYFSEQDAQKALQLAISFMDDPANKEKFGLRRDAMLEGHANVADVILDMVDKLCH
ncbi:DUF354 domain-containing protein [Desulfovibrio sp. OttesenSCG-928-G15]|nr:DUF354 domain-containing protein [Desulfovibrio sp. OttesenSCG-928-G15]